LHFSPDEHWQQEVEGGLFVRAAGVDMDVMGYRTDGLLDHGTLTALASGRDDAWKGEEM
jgi:hypothetical protein